MGDLVMDVSDGREGRPRGFAAGHVTGSVGDQQPLFKFSSSSTHHHHPPTTPPPLAPRTQYRRSHASFPGISQRTARTACPRPEVPPSSCRGRSASHEHPERLTHHPTRAALDSDIARARTVIILSILLP